MKIKRFIFASIILLTYFIEFAHNFVPHFHEITPIVGMVSAKNDQLHDLTHSHSETSSNTVSFEHLEHSDVGFIEYVICLLESSEHKSTKPETQLINNFELEVQSCTQLAILPNETILPIELAGFIVENQTSCFDDTTHFYHPIL